MSFFQIFTRRKLYIHLGVLALLVVVIFWGVFKVLDHYTRHGDVYLVPKLEGVTLEQTKEKNYDEFFEFVITDSVYSNKFGPGAIVMQKPSPNSKVKKGRKIYITIVASGKEKVDMPNLVDLSLRQALVELKSSGLGVESLKYVPDLARNAVLAQLYHGDTILPGDKVGKGEDITLILGKGTREYRIRVPLLIGKDLEDAKDALNERSLNLGQVIYLDQDTTDALVYKQFPGALYNQQLPSGEKVKVWMKSGKDFDVNNQIQELKNDSLEINWDNSVLFNMEIDTLESDSLNQLMLEMELDSLDLEEDF